MADHLRQHAGGDGFGGGGAGMPRLPAVRGRRFRTESAAGPATNETGDGPGMKFTGKLRGESWEAGLDYFQTRYFSSAQGRYTSPDPLMASATPSNPQTWNRYA